MFKRLIHFFAVIVLSLPSFLTKCELDEEAVVDNNSIRSTGDTIDIPCEPDEDE